MSKDLRVKDIGNSMYRNLLILAYVCGCFEGCLVNYPSAIVLRLRFVRIEYKELFLKFFPPEWFTYEGSLWSFIEINYLK